LGFLVFAMCVLPRAAAVFLWPAQSTYYWELAGSLAHGHGFALDGEPVTFIEPLYPAFLAVSRMVTADRATAVALLQAAVGALGGVLLWRCADRLAGARAAWFATLLYAIYPYYVRQSGAWIEVTLATTLAIGTVWQYLRIDGITRAALCGLWFGLLILTRSTFLVALAAFAAVLVTSRHLDRALALLVVAAGVSVPWMLRNHAIDGSWLPPRVGENLFVSTSEFSRAAGPRYDVDLLVEHSYELIADEAVRRSAEDPSPRRVADRILFERALAYTAAHPLEVAWLKARNFLYLFDPRLLPAYEKSSSTRAIVDGSAVRVEGLERRPWIEEWAHALAQSVLLVLGAMGLWRRRHQLRTDHALLLMAGSLALVYTVFFPTTRLLAPGMWVLMVYASLFSDPSQQMRDVGRRRDPRVGGHECLEWLSVTHKSREGADRCRPAPSGRGVLPGLRGFTSPRTSFAGSTSSPSSTLPLDQRVDLPTPHSRYLFNSGHRRIMSTLAAIGATPYGRSSKLHGNGT